MNELPLVVYIFAFLIGCIPLFCCVVMQEIKGKGDRKRCLT